MPLAALIRDSCDPISVTIRRVDLDSRREVDRFIRFPFDLYRRDRLWVPPFIRDARAQLDREQNPFFSHSRGDCFLAERDREILGRIAVLWHRFYNERHHNDTAFFYFFDAVDSVEVAESLFDAARDWAATRGLKRILGPIGFIQPDPPGVLVDGFEHPPALNVPYNFPYYDGLLQGVGLDSHSEYVSGYIDRSYSLAPSIERFADSLKDRNGYVVKSFSSRSEVIDWAPRVSDLYNEAFSEIDDYYPMRTDEFTTAVKRFVEVVDPKGVKLLLHKDRIIGFIFAFFDISHGLRQARGQLFPLGWYHLWRAFRTTEWGNINGIGLLPEYQNSGANAILITELTRSLLESQFKYFDLVQIKAENLVSFGDMEAIGVKWYKRHRVYRGEV